MFLIFHHCKSSSFALLVVVYQVEKKQYLPVHRQIKGSLENLERNGTEWNGILNIPWKIKKPGMEN